MGFALVSDSDENLPCLFGTGHGCTAPNMTDDELASRCLPTARWLAKWYSQTYHQVYDEVYSDALLGIAMAIRNRSGDLTTFQAYARKTMKGYILHGIRDRWDGNRPFYEGTRDYAVEKVPLHANLVDPNNVVYEIERRELWEKVDTLPTRGALLLRLYYQWEVTQYELADLFGFSQMHISRLLEKARQDLSHELVGYSVSEAPVSILLRSRMPKNQMRNGHERRWARDEGYHLDRKPKAYTRADRREWKKYIEW